MPGVPRIRGHINLVLNRLIREGVIAGFRTSFGVDNGPGAPLVTVAAPEGRSPDEVKMHVMDALADVAIGLNVAVEPERAAVTRQNPEPLAVAPRGGSPSTP